MPIAPKRRPVARVGTETRRGARGAFAFVGRGLGRVEGGLVALALAAMAALPIAQATLRAAGGGGISGVQPLVQHLTLWLAFLGAALATRRGDMLSLATGQMLPQGAWRMGAKAFAHAVAVLVSTLLARACVELVRSERDYGTGTLSVLGLGDLPVWMAQLVLPVAFTIIALRLLWQAGSVPGRVLAGAAMGVGVWLGQVPALTEGGPAWPWLLLVIAAMIVGAPIFTVLGGAAIFLFLVDGVPIAAVPAETYRLSVSPTLPAIPLFTLAGFLLAEGQASARLLALFRALVGWLPGGAAVMTAALCAFFTVFTGGSGVTILALGALLHAALLRDGYRERFATGLITASGSLGLLWAPAVPLILYGIVAQVPIKELFIGGALPGLVLLAMIAGWGVFEGRRSGAGRTPFSWPALGRALWQAKWEVLLPVVVVVGIFSGLATLVESSALAALGAFLIVTVVHREVPFARLEDVLTRCGSMIGGILIILGVAMGLTGYLVDAQIPMHLLGWVETHVESPLVFLLALNVLLLLVGCLMDIFSAIVVVVPLVAPLGLAFGIDPVHLGIIFVANLELGYLTPPVGLNLFLASFRFKRPLAEVYRAVLVPLALLAVGVLLITYVPFLTTVFLR